jgi:hypothetical protein
MGFVMYTVLIRGTGQYETGVSVFMRSIKVCSGEVTEGEVLG